MSSTYVRVSFGLYAIPVKKKSSFSCSDIQAFSKLADLEADLALWNAYATYEPDFWLLSGAYKILDTDYTDVHVGLVSQSMSGADGSFTNPILLVIEFSEPCTADGLSLRFSPISGDYADDIDVVYYDDVDAVLASDSYTPDNAEFSTDRIVNNFSKITITFNSTNNPYRYLRLQGVDFGKLIIFEADDIENADMIEQFDPLSLTLPISTADLDIYSEDAEFSIINPSGLYADLQQRQPLSIYASINGAMIFLGRYYLENWKNKTHYNISFSCQDLIGVLDGQTYLGGLWTAETVSDLLDGMLTAIDIPYDLDNDLADIEITGWLPICSYREALQKIAFVIGASVSSSRTGLLRIAKSLLPDDLTDFSMDIDDDNQALNPSLELKPLVTKVEITSHEYIENIDETELLNATLEAGQYLIKFTSPQHDLGITGANIDYSGANYAVISLDTNSAVVLTGKGYTDTARLVSTEDVYLPENVKENVISISDVGLVHPGNAKTLSDRVYNYYQARLLHKSSLIATPFMAGGSVVVNTLFDQQINGIIEKASTNLSGGFISKIEVVGILNE